MATSDRKRKRETNEEDHTKMDTEHTAQFPQINPSELKVEINLNKTQKQKFDSFF